MEIVKIKRRIRSKSSSNVKVNTKIINRQVTIVKNKCNKGESRKKCISKKKRIIRKKLIKVHRCVPIQTQCDEHCVIPIFAADTSHSIISHPSGTFTITNNSDLCNIKVIIKQKSQCQHFDFICVEPKSSFTGVLSNVECIEIECSSHIENAICIGTFEFDVVYVVRIK